MLEARFTVQQEGGAGQRKWQLVVECHGPAQEQRTSPKWTRIRLEFVGTNVGAKLIHKMKMGYAY